MSPSKKALMPALFCTALILSGCAGSDLAAWNQKISDAAHSLSSGSASNTNNSDMPWMTKAGNTGSRQHVLHVYTLPVDVDTAAARLKSHYQFISSDELESLRKRDQYGDWSAGSVDEAHSVWSAVKGNVTGTLQMLGSKATGGGNAQHPENGGWGKPQQPASAPAHSGTPQAQRSLGNEPPVDFNDDIPFLGLGYGIAKSAIHAL